MSIIIIQCGVTVLNTEIIEYLKKKYNPISIIVYGSFADGSNNINSDFDALLISKDIENVKHDTGFVSNIQLDVFIYPISIFQSQFNCDDFVQIEDGVIVFDTDDFALSIKNKITDHVNLMPKKSLSEIESDVAWCKKMYLRVKRNDVEGFFRYHWLLTESLQIFCDIVGNRYRGPKKSLKWMERNYPKAFEIYTNALSGFDLKKVEIWIDELEYYFNKSL